MIIKIDTCINKYWLNIKIYVWATIISWNDYYKHFRINKILKIKIEKKIKN